ncbi:MAG: hypothetical protein UT58_C0001G0035 [Microgenomates group bacterium GW2011_GWC1_39_7b]|uniref:Uncharacterized protein n=2 Tax=Candidatus Woeseibacteriota TaxID=1752722 RepID=A0A0G0LV22_9BACT|nr:MAG: hypothetical protein UT17_C0004G0198 [Candidatus Woesebacteria bacterium GW2011_GWB1_39_10]KKR27057.1 MAG: hypothetical protein UT58_C0001G0035 [Microgenomates group bacterium GW2011_GWC1_39_7b]KKS90840.1 MAG: hypothetical protein UV66_C0001G0197 [Candidatus Woesebacteria bacterium GW2011_GWA1_43_12]
MKKLIWFTTATILFLVFLFPAVLAMGIKLIPNGDQPGYNSDQRLGVYGIRDISQKFISEKANLSAIGTSIRNPNLQNKKDIIFTLFDEKMNIVRTTIINGRNVEDGNFIKFVFEPIFDSKNKTYTFEIVSPDAGPGDTIEVFYVENGISLQSMPNWIVEYTYDKKIHKGGLPIVLYFKPTSKFEIIKEIYTNLFSRFQSLDSQKI